MKNNLLPPSNMRADGWADDVTPPSYAKNYLYPCNRAATLWYHDHAVHITADNAYAGLAGQFIVKDCETDLEKNYLPTEEHSIPLVVRDAIIDTQPPYNLVYHGGRLSAVGAHEDFLYGDINLVNGKPWPKLEVDPITYRMRALNPSLSRQFMLKFLAESSAGRQTWIPFWMLQSDGGALRDMVQTHSLFLAVAERYTIAVNFDPLSVVYPLLPDGETWSHVYLVNDFGPSGNQPPMFCKTHLLARFDLASRTSARPSPQGIDRELTRSGGTNNPPPMVLSRQGKPYLGLRNVVPQSEIDAGMELARRGDFHREFDFGRANGHWVINGCVWDDESCRIIANPKRNGVEVWKLKGHGGWTHPVHIHEIDFLILRRTGGSTDLWEDYDPLKPNGQPEPKFVTLPDTAKDVGLDAPWVEDEVRPWEWNAAKDVVHLGEGQDVWVLARYGSNDGDFMFHCHNLVHEDNDMMVAIGIGRTKPSSASDIALTDVQGADYWNVAPDAAVTPEELWALGPSSPGGENISPYAPQISGKVDVELRNAMGDVARPLTADDRFANGRVSPTYICERLCRKIYASYFPSNPSQGSPRGETEDPFILNNVWAAHWQHWKRGDESEDLSTTGFQNLHPNYQKHDRDSDACDCSLVRE
jgi:bilirubin oxidase